MRQPFGWKGGPAAGLHLLIAHDEDVVVYLNGVEAATLAGYASGHVMIPVSQAAAALTLGVNTMGVRCQQTNGAQAIDVGLLQTHSGALWNRFLESFGVV